MGYAEETRDFEEYIHRPFDVPSHVVEDTRALYKLSVKDYVNAGIYCLLRRASQYASQGSSGSVNTWAQIMRIAEFPALDNKFTDGDNAKTFVKTLSVLTYGNPIGELTTTDVELQLLSTDEDGTNLASDAILQLLTDREAIVDVDRITYELGDQACLQAFLDGRSWELQYPDNSLEAISVRSLASAIIRDRVNSVYQASE